MRLNIASAIAILLAFIGLAGGAQQARAQEEGGAPMNIVPGASPLARQKPEPLRTRARTQPAPKPLREAKAEPSSRIGEEAPRPAPEPKPAPVSAAPVPVPVPAPAPTREPVEDAALARDYCSAIGAHASDALMAWQVRRIAELEKKLDERIAELERKRAEHQTWLERQQETQKKMDDGVVAILAKMRPDAAASQLSVMDETVAAALLARLEPRGASVILNEMSAAKAARLADNMTGRATPARSRQ